jgi:hypothetical protein
MPGPLVIGAGIALRGVGKALSKVVRKNKKLSFSEKMKLQDKKIIDKKTGKTHLSKKQLDNYVKTQKDPKLKKLGKLEQKYIKERPGMAPK